MLDSLYDYHLGSTPWEEKWMGGIFAFWRYRKASLAQFGGILTESFTEPGTRYWSKALTGQTKVNRLQSFGELQGVVRDSIMWQDPNETLDDEEQLLAWGRTKLPWYNQAMTTAMSMVSSPSRMSWEEARTGKKMTHEVLALPAAQGLDDLYMLGQAFNVAAASIVWATRPDGVSAESIDAVFERTQKSFGESLLPLWREIYEGTRDGFWEDRPHGASVPRETALLGGRVVPRALADLATTTDKYGGVRWENNAAGWTARMLATHPWWTEMARAWSVFDNPSQTESVSKWILESAGRISGLVKPVGYDPMTTRSIEESQEGKRLRGIMD